MDKRIEDEYVLKRNRTVLEVQTSTTFIIYLSLFTLNLCDGVTADIAYWSLLLVSSICVHIWLDEFRLCP